MIIIFYYNTWRIDFPLPSMNKTSNQKTFSCTHQSWWINVCSSPSTGQNENSLHLFARAWMCTVHTYIHTHAGCSPIPGAPRMCIIYFAIVFQNLRYEMRAMKIFWSIQFGSIICAIIFDSFWNLKLISEMHFPALSRKW